MSLHMDSLMANRARICVAAIAFECTGDISIATSDGAITSAIQCYKVWYLLYLDSILY